MDTKTQPTKFGLLVQVQFNSESDRDLFRKKFLVEPNGVDPLINARVSLPPVHVKKSWRRWRRAFPGTV